MFPLISDSYSRPINWIVVVATFYQTFLLCSHNILQSLGAVPHNFLERSGETREENESVDFWETYLCHIKKNKCTQLWSNKPFAVYFLNKFISPGRGHFLHIFAI